MVKEAALCLLTCFNFDATSELKPNLFAKRNLSALLTEKLSKSKKMDG